MQLQGIHHLSAITGDASGNYDFYTRVLGMRLVKKTVNQDDPGAYHLFYADGTASPGTDLTFFDYLGELERGGTNAIVRTSLRVSGSESCVTGPNACPTSASHVGRWAQSTVDANSPSKTRKGSASPWSMMAERARRIPGAAAASQSTVRSEASGPSLSA